MNNGYHIEINQRKTIYLLLRLCPRVPYRFRGGSPQKRSKILDKTLEMSGQERGEIFHGLLI